MTAPVATKERSQSPSKKTESTTSANPELGLKVYFGNLDADTTVDQLRDFASKAGSVNTVLVRTSRVRNNDQVAQLGYGFVLYDSKDSAEKAISMLNGNKLGSSEVKAEMATAITKRGERTRGRGRGRRGRAPGRPTDGSAVEGTEARSIPTRGPRRPLRGRDAPETEASKTLLYVGNLPYKCTEDELRSIFQDYKIADAYIARFFGRPQGYGFVEAVSDNEQQRILSELQSVVVGERQLLIKAARQKENGDIRHRREIDAERVAKRNEKATPAA